MGQESTCSSIKHASSPRATFSLKIIGKQHPLFLSRATFCKQRRLLLPPDHSITWLDSRAVRYIHIGMSVGVSLHSIMGCLFLLIVNLIFEAYGDNFFNNLNSVLVPVLYAMRVVQMPLWNKKGMLDVRIEFLFPIFLGLLKKCFSMVDISGNKFVWCW